MFGRLTFSLGLIVYLAGAGHVAPPKPVVGTPGDQSSMADLLANYVDWVQGRRAEVSLVAMDLEAARRELTRVSPADVPTRPGLSPADARESRRRLLTSFALEVAAANANRHAADAAKLVEWACPYIRAHAPQNDFDRAWELAALAVLEGGIASNALIAHLDHARATTVDEPRFVLARGIAEEQFGAPSESLYSTPIAADLFHAREALTRAEGERRRAAERAIVRFREAAKDDGLRAEAELRLGHVQLEEHAYTDALASWAGLESHTTDGALVYLVQLFRGIAHEGLGQDAEARASYEGALQLSPGAHSATMRLSALDFRRGHAGDPGARVAALMLDDDPRRDPWWSYYAADWRFWYTRITRVRDLLR